jgi:hypothetical protein
VGVDHVVVGDAHRQGKGHQGLGAAEAGLVEVALVARGLVAGTAGHKVLVDDVEIIVRDKGIPHVGLVVRDGAAPALAGALALAGPQASRVLLPDDSKARAAGRADHGQVGVAAARGQSLGLEPHDVAELHGRGLVAVACSLTRATFKWRLVSGALSVVRRWVVFNVHRRKRALVEFLLAGDHPARCPQARVGDLADAQLGHVVDLVIVHRTLLAAHAPDVGDIVIVIVGIVGLADLGALVRVAPAVDRALVLLS